MTLPYVAPLQQITSTGWNALVDEVNSIAAGSDTVINVADPAFGAVGYPTDDTTAIEAAWTAALAANKPLIFPSGAWVYNGAGLDPGVGEGFVIRGQGRDTSIVLGASSYLVDTTQPVTGFQLSDLTIVGGLGAIRSTSTADATNPTLRTIERVFFHDYTKAAISHSSTDCPNWQIRGCTFWADETSTTSMGVALSGLTDTVSITECEFRHNRVHVKLGDGGNNAHIDRCGFLRYNTARPGSHPVVDLWVVPKNAYTNMGEGLTVTNNKFGNENVVAGDYRVVFASEGAGTNFGDRFPDLSTNLTTDQPAISGHVYAGNLLGGSAATPPFIYSMTAAIFGIHVGPLTLAGGLPSHLVGISHQPANGDRRFSAVNTIGPIQGLLVDGPLIKACNYPGLFTVADDPNRLLATHGLECMDGPGEATGYLSILDLAVSAWADPGTGTTSNDVLGRPSARIADVNASYAGLHTLTGYTPGVPMWLEFDMRQGGASPVTRVRWKITGNPSFTYWSRVIDVQTSWTHYRFPFTIDDPDSVGVSLWVPLTLSGTGTVEFGRVRSYPARESLNVDGHLVDLAHRGTRAGFYGATPIVKPTGVAVTAAGIHAALVSLGLIGA